MSQCVFCKPQSLPLSAELVTYRACFSCHKSETKKHRFSRCGACHIPAYCSVECQKKDWKSHKKSCQLQTKNRESIEVMRGTPERDMLLDIKKWAAKHTYLLIYVGMHALKPHDPAVTSEIKPDMLVLELDPAPGDKRGEFIFKSVSVCRVDLPEYNLDAATCAALTDRAADAARDLRCTLTMYVWSGTVVYLLPINVARNEPEEHLWRFGPPDKDWEKFLERAINKDLLPEDAMRIKRIREVV
ncbi:hypothetical protein C8R43DRAFT_984815 [Mycena crocata]|nr:hypothetical protein C8R43DRAFT_984815 [Mycena crocata]